MIAVIRPSLDSARTFIIIDCRSRITFDRFSRISARLPPVSLWTESDTTNIRMSSRSHRSAMFCKRIAKFGAVGHFVDDNAELRSDRIGHLDGQQVERGSDRMPGAKAADEHVERDRELVLRSSCGACSPSSSRTISGRNRAEHGRESRADHDAAEADRRCPDARHETASAAKKTATGAIRTISISRGVAIVTCACISIRSSLRAKRVDDRRKPFGIARLRAPQQVHRLAVARGRGRSSAAAG